MLFSLFIILLVIVLVGVLLLAIPVDLEFAYAWPMTRDNQLRVRWAGGLVNIPVGSSGAEDDALADKPSPPSGSRNRSSIDGFKLLRQRRFRQRCWQLLGDLWRAIRKHNIHLRAKVGLGDPAATGQLWGVLGPASAIAATHRTLNVAIEPDFSEATLELDSAGKLRVIPLQLVTLLLVAALSPALWQGLRAARAA